MKDTTEIALLRAIADAAKKLIEAKGRYHTQLAFDELREATATYDIALA